MKKNIKNDKSQVSTFLIKDVKTNTFLSHLAFIIPLCIVFLIVQNYVFKKDIDINGDNATYYVYASSIDQGYGYSNILLPSKPKTNNFPPGYPLLMSIVMKFSKSFIAQKVFNSILLLLSCFLIYFIIYNISKNQVLSLAASILPTLNYSILHFNSMMMSETSFIFFSLLAFFSIYKLQEPFDFKKILYCPYFYLLTFSSSYAFHIRIQGIALIGAIAINFLIQKNWKLAITYFTGFILSALPWIIRNKLVGVEQSRYVSQILTANPWRPEDGILSIDEVITRMFSTIKMLITKAIPDSIIPNSNINYLKDVSILSWIIGIAIILLIVYGFWRCCKKNKWLYLLYIIFNCGIITLWSAPSGNRYLISIIPFLQMGFLFGIVSLLLLIAKKIELKNLNANIIVLFLITLFVFVSSKDIYRLDKINSRKQHPAYTNFYSIARAVKKSHPRGDVVVSSRKPSLFYLYSNCFNVRYSYSLNDSIVINNMLKNKVDYVVLDQLGYSSTDRYLVPAINKNPNLFKTVMHLKNPDTYLLWFDKVKARESQH